MPLTAHERLKYHLELADAYANPLDAENAVLADDVIHEETKLVADQGRALRNLLFHCTAALCAQLEKATQRR